MLLASACDQARIHRKAFTADEAGRDARADDPLEEPAGDAAVTEALIACA